MTTRTDEFLTVPEVAAILKIGKWKVHDLIRTGALASIQIGRCRRIPPQAIDDLIRTLTEGDH